MEDADIIEKLKKKLFETFSEYTELGGGFNYRYVHANRVADMSKRYVKENDIKVDETSLIIACLLHDVGKISFIKDDMIDLDAGDNAHCIEGAKNAAKILDELGYKEQTVCEKVQEIILNHHQTDHQITEVKILQHADDLDELGIISLWRMFGYSNQTKRGPEDTCVYWEVQYPKAKEKIEKNFTIPFFKEIAEKRLKLANETFKKFKKELNSTD